MSGLFTPAAATLIKTSEGPNSGNGVKKGSRWCLLVIFRAHIICGSSGVRLWSAQPLVPLTARDTTRKVGKATASFKSGRKYNEVIWPTRGKQSGHEAWLTKYTIRETHTHVLRNQTKGKASTPSSTRRKHKKQALQVSHTSKKVNSEVKTKIMRVSSRKEFRPA